MPRSIKKRLEHFLCLLIIKQRVTIHVGVNLKPPSIDNCKFLSISKFVAILVKNKIFRHGLFNILFKTCACY